MTTIFIVKMGSNNSFTNFEWAFKNYDDALKFRDYLDREKMGATDIQSSIKELNYYEEYPTTEVNK